MSLDLKKTGANTLSLETDTGLRVDNVELRIDVLGPGSTEAASLGRSAWESVEPDQAGLTCFEQRLFSGDELAAVATMVARPGFAELQIEVLRPLRLAGRADTFEQSSVALPAFGFGEGVRFLVTTYGLGPSGEGEIGGYWPCAIVGRGSAALPAEAFAPMVLFDSSAAIAVAPGSQFLTSSLLREDGGVGRGLHGSVVDLEAGTMLRTLFVDGPDVGDALIGLGDLLLDRAGKARPRPDDSVMTSTLGWWNAYGGYYTEPIHPLGESALREVIAGLREASIPIGYLGIDLWYPYATIGQALRFSPDLSKYPGGLGSIAREAGLATVPHLSALSPDNEYGSDGSDPSIYRAIAEELTRQEAAVAWHDWLRTQQHMTPVLRSNVVAADRWFEGLAEALSDRGIQVLACMQTMGMVLASTRCGNAISSRSTIDYLFAQEEAMATLDALGQPGFRDNETPLHVMRRQNLLVGFVQYAMGLLPFHDLFLTTWHEKLGGAHPKQEAVLRALSCGPVGIGDAPGATDAELVRSMLSSDGRLFQPDRPPFPMVETLGAPIEVYRTHRRAGGLTWTYLVVLNTTDQSQAYDVANDLRGTDVLIWNGLAGRIADSISGTLPSGCLAYYVLVRYIAGIAPLGLRDKLVPAPVSAVQDVRFSGVLEIDVNAPGEAFAFATKGSMAVADQHGTLLPIEYDGSLWICVIPEGATSLHVRGGDLP